MEIIDVEYGNFDRVTAQKAMENALIKAANRGQTIDAVFAHSDEDGLGPSRPSKVAGLPPGEIAIVSINGIQDCARPSLPENIWARWRATPLGIYRGFPDTADGTGLQAIPHGNDSLSDYYC